MPLSFTKIYLKSMHKKQLSIEHATLAATLLKLTKI